MMKKLSTFTTEDGGNYDEVDIPLLPMSTDATLPNPNFPLKLDTEGLLALTTNQFVSARAVVLGQTGSGKGNTGALLEEHLLEHGLPMTIIDLEGESWSLKEVWSNLLVVGRSVHADREYSPEQAGRLAELSVEQGFSIVLDFSGYEEDEYYAFLVPYLRSLWKTCDRLRKPYHLIVDEVHEFVPQTGTTPVKAMLIRMAKRGRKRGLGMISMSQETATVDNQLLKQTDIRILLPVSYDADLERYATLIPGMSKEEIKRTVPKLPPGKGFVIFNHTPHLVQLLRRRTYDPSETPKLGTDVPEPKLYDVDTATLQVLDEELSHDRPQTPERLDRATLIEMVKQLSQEREALQRSELQSSLPSQESLRLLERIQEVETEKTQLESTVAEVEGKNQFQQHRIQELEQQVNLLGKLSIQADVRGPDRLEIEKAVVHQMDVQKRVPVIETSLQQTKPLKSIEQQRTVTLGSLDQKRFDGLKRRIEKLPDLAARLLRLLYTHKGAMSREDAILELQVSQATFYRYKPHELLLKQKFIVITEEGQRHLYTSNLSNLLLSMFPHIDRTTVLEGIAPRLFNT